jgi:SAM-dependent methyltransferase
MLDPSGLYDSARLAAGYAFARPPVHPRVIDLVRARLALAAPLGRGLDIGCGAGRSTAALTSVARLVVGLEPSPVMLRHAAAVAPGASFVRARAEALPFADAVFDIITAAGALNYVDLEQALPAAARVLTPGGRFVIYDFSSGRRSPDEPQLARWFDAFEARYPFPPGYDLDVRTMAFDRAGLRLHGYEPFEIALTIAPGAYLEYVLTESNVERAVASGVPDRDVRAWCEATLAPVFGGRTLPVLFDGYIADVRRGGARA